jgi:N-acetylglutamate synthase-like GNAT family acetyltransferase
MSYRVVEYEDKYQQAVVDLILPIQQNEFNVPATIKDQPDLLNISSFYKKSKGNFWVALYENEVIGTIAVVDFSEDQAALRKMFVHRDHRGKEKGVGQQLLNELKNWCKSKGIDELFLGTFKSMRAAHRFYEKNGFVELKKEGLPATFPLVSYDNMFFTCNLLQEPQEN